VALRIFGREYASSKGFVRGTHRTRPPAESYLAFRPLMARAGITRLADITALDYVRIPVFVAFRPNSRSLATAQGKGLDRDSARVSALMEALEVWHAEFMDLPARWDSYQNLRRSEAVIDVERLLRMRPFRTERPRAWVQGFDVMAQRAVWVPIEAVSANFVDSGDPDVFMSTNGLASGNHLLEAVLHGLAELIERDATALWRLAPGMSLIDLETVEEEYCRRLVAALRQAGVFVAAWDMTSDIGVAACGAVVLNEPEQNRWRVLGAHYGFGCHPDPAVALSRAISEAVQTRLTYISGSRDDFLREAYAQASNPDLLAAIHQDLSARPPTVRLGDLPNLATPRFEDDIAVLLERLRLRGIEQVVVVDLTKPDVGLPVAKVLAPGLEMDEGGTLPGERLERAAEEASA
jgi:YcaO-like protein with predicted kinase domain